MKYIIKYYWHGIQMINGIDGNRIKNQMYKHYSQNIGKNLMQRTVIIT